MCLGVPGRLTEIGEEEGLRVGRVDFTGVARWVCLELVPEVKCGEYVLVHVGFALCRLDPDEAERLLGMLRELEPELAAP
jgi:hydrogenase expression/formation protein HypC